MIWCVCGGKNPVEDIVKPWQATIDVIMAVTAPELCCSGANNGRHVDMKVAGIRSSPRFLLISPVAAQPHT